MILQTYLFFGICLIIALGVGAAVLRRKKYSGMEAAAKIQRLVLVAAIVIAIAYTMVTRPQPTKLWDETPKQVVVVTDDRQFTLSSEALLHLEEVAMYCGPSRLQGINRTMAGPVRLMTPEGEDLVVLRDGLMRRGVWIYKGDYQPLLDAIREVQD